MDIRDLMRCCARRAAYLDVGALGSGLRALRGVAGEHRVGEGLGQSVRYGARSGSEMEKCVMAEERVAQHPTVRGEVPQSREQHARQAIVVR